MAARACSKARVTAGSFSALSASSSSGSAASSRERKMASRGGAAALRLGGHERQAADGVGEHAAQAIVDAHGFERRGRRRRRVRL